MLLGSEASSRVLPPLNANRFDFVTVEFGSVFMFPNEEHIPQVEPGLL
jgi:hypothetical protein